MTGKMTGDSAMKAVLVALALSAAMAGSAAAQDVNLTGRWQCVAACAGPLGGIAYVTQYGWDLNVEAGVSFRAWIDHPGHIWIESARQGALYSPDGSRLQFESGTVWQRAPEMMLPPSRRRG